MIWIHIESDYFFYVILSKAAIELKPPYSCSFGYSQGPYYESILKYVWWKVMDLIVVQQSTR